MRLTVVSHAAWLARELSAAPGVEVVASLGLDVSTEPTAWWCPGRFATRLAATCLTPLLRSPGPGFLPGLDASLLRRRVILTDLASASGHLGAVFAKPADTKVPGLEAKVWPDGATFRAAAEQAGLHPGSAVLLSTPVELDHEVRVFVCRGQVAAASAYLLAGRTWESWDPADLPPVAEHVTLAREVASGYATGQSYALDIARTAGGDLVVVEANPAWSAAPYWASLTHPEQVVASILTSQGPGAVGPLWVADPARDTRPLPIVARHTGAGANQAGEG